MNPVSPSAAAVSTASPTPMPRRCTARRLGRVGYREAHRLQRELVLRRVAGRVGDTLLLLEHPHVITLGRNAALEHLLAGPDLLARKGVEVVETDRGGDVTYHGPGQLIGYPILSLRPDRCDIARYVGDVEETLLRTLADFGIEAGRVAGRRGVWVEDRKVAAVGIRISRWVTSHGFALNVSTDLDYFGLIVPCGIAGCGVTSMERLLGRAVGLDEVMDRIEANFAEVFERRMEAGDA